MGLGYRIERKGDGWDLASVPQSILDKFSRRTAQIEERARELGITSEALKAQLGLATRERKQKDLTNAELLREWESRLTPEERQALQRVRQEGSPVEHVTSPVEAMDYAIAHVFERSSVVSDKELLREALRHGIGSVSVEGAKAELQRSSFLREAADEREWLTTREVLEEKKTVIAWVRAGHGTLQPFHANVGQYECQDERLSDEQRAAVLHVLGSRDRVTAIRGVAGAAVFTFAPSADASRGVLRSEGFKDAETVEMLLQNQELQDAVRGQVLWINEAGLMSMRQMKRLCDLAERQGCRLVLSGDAAQHGAVERGDALRILQNHAGLVAAEVKSIRRQKAEEYRQAEGAFQRLARLDGFLEVADGERHTLLATEYVEAIRECKSALVVSPTHAEGERVTALIRERLCADGQPSARENDCIRLRSLQWTEAQRQDAGSYRGGEVVQFHQNCRGLRRGERGTVARTTDNRIVIQSENGAERELPLSSAKRFAVFRAETLPLAVGDQLRITANGYTADGNHRLNNGSLHRLTAFTENGELVLANGWTIRKDFGHLAHGYCVTSHASQGKTVDRVFIAESAESFRAGSREQFYVSVSRARESVRIFTDNVKGLRAAVAKSSRRRAAVDLAARHAIRAGVAPRTVRGGIGHSMRRLGTALAQRVSSVLKLRPQTTRQSFNQTV